MYDEVSSIAELYWTAFGPRSGAARKVLPPAQAKPEPMPPSRSAGTPFSRFPVRPDKSALAPADDPVKLPTASSVGADRAEPLASNVVAKRIARAELFTSDPRGFY